MRISESVIQISRLGAAFFLLAAAASAVRADQTPLLLVSDCGKCHSYEVSAVMAKGGKHKTAVTCLDCHQEHLPEGGDTIAPCSRCHGGSPHVDMADTTCLQCHTKPHMPIASLKFPFDAKDGCVSCHAKQGNEVAEFKSKHGDQACTFCHHTHVAKPDCQACHRPHSADPEMADCRHCHPTHHPLQIKPIGHTPVKLCSPCHEQVAADLRKTMTRHGTLSCVYCHGGPHPPAIPKCRDCHGLPHGIKIHGKFNSCKECHNGPHLLVS